MIEGIKATVTGTELIGLLMKQSAFHTERARVYQDQVQSMLDSKIALPENYSGNPREQLETKVTQHKNSAAELDFILTRIEKEEKYRLGSEDLVKIGVKRW